MSTDTQSSSPSTSLTTLSSSKFAAAMGISPWLSRKKLWRLMTGRETPDNPVQRMKWGVHNEWRAVAAVEAHTGLIFDYTGDRQHTRTLPHAGTTLRATPDGIAGTIGLEVKCPERCYEDIPPHYMAQIQGQIRVCGMVNVFFACWGNSFFKCWNVPRSKLYIEAMLPLLQEFLGYIHSDTEPPRLARKPVMPEVSYHLMEDADEHTTQT